MNRFWNTVIKPCLEIIDAHTIVEVGADKGICTKNIIEYCRERNGKAISIDPFPQFNYKKWEEQDRDCFKLYEELSLSRLPLLKNYDAILIDGDHNWYTVYNELKIIEEQFKDNLPLIFFHDIGWPYDRRDLYYNPDNIPEIYKQPYKQMGIHPDSSQLVEANGINNKLNNSIYVNNPKNGVLTGIEDFMKEALNKNLKLIRIPYYHTLGILIDPDKYPKINEILCHIDIYINFMEKAEKDRILNHIQYQNMARNKWKNEHMLGERIRLLQEKEIRYEQDNKQLEQQNTDKEKYINELKQQNADREKYINELEQQNVDKEKYINELEQRNVNKEKYINELEQRNVNNEKLISELRDNSIQLHYVKEEIKNKEELSNQLKNNYEQVECKLKKMQEAYKRAENQINRLRQDVEIHLHSKRYQIGSVFVDTLKHKSLGAIITIPNKLIKIYKASPFEITNKFETSSDKKNVDKKLINNSSTENKMHTFEEERGAFNKYYKFSSLIHKLEYPLSADGMMVVSYMQKLKSILSSIYDGRNQDKKVSIIMPTYNRAKIIENAIASILDQSYKNWELLICDDGSQDNTEEVVSKYTQDKRIHYMKNVKIKGVSGARNTALEKATGDYVAYLDTDNRWDKDYLLLVVNTFADYPKYKAVYTAQNIFRYDGTKSVLQSVRLGVFNRSILENRNYIDLNCYVHSIESYKRFGGFDENLKRLVDWDLIMRYSQEECPYALPCIISDYYFENTDNQMTSKSASDYLVVLEQFTRKFNQNILPFKELNKLNLNGYKMYNENYIREYNVLIHKIAIIIPNYEALDCLKVCLAAIEAYTPNQMAYQVIIVDNCSQPETQEYLKSINKQYSRVKVIQNDYNMGFTYAVNQGIEVAEKDADIILMNNDAIVTENWVQEMYRVKDDIKEAGIIVPRQVLIPYTKTMDVHVPMGVKSRELDVSLSVHHDNIKDVEVYQNTGYVELSFAPFFLVMITRECYDILGALDEKNGRHYKSDRLYCGEALNHGIKIIYTPYAKAYHLLQQSTAVLKKNDKKMYKAIFEKNNWEDIDYEAIKKVH